MFVKVVTLAGAEEEELLAAGLVDGDVGFADDFEFVALHHDGGRFVDADADEFRRGLDEGVQVMLAVAYQDVLVDRGEFQEAQPLAYLLSFPLALGFILHFLKLLPREDRDMK